MKKEDKSPELIELLKESLGIENANCSTCIHTEDVGDGGDYSYESFLVCSINDGYGNLKSFPFKKQMKCWEPGFWFSKFPDMIKQGTDKELNTAQDAFESSYESVITTRL